MCVGYGADSFAIRVAQQWIILFRSGGSGRSRKIKEIIAAIVAASQELNISHMIVQKHLKKLSYKINSMFGCHTNKIKTKLLLIFTNVFSYLTK